MDREQAKEFCSATDRVATTRPIRRSPRRCSCSIATRGWLVGSRNSSAPTKRSAPLSARCPCPPTSRSAYWPNRRSCGLISPGSRLVLVAAAAAVILLGAISLWAFRAGAIGGVTAYRAEMVRHVEKGYLMSVRASNFDQLRQILAERKWPSDFIVPDRLRDVTVVGGSALEWKGHKVALACMQDHRRGLWLFVVENAAFRSAPDSETQAPDGRDLADGDLDSRRRPPPHRQRRRIFSAKVSAVESEALPASRLTGETQLPDGRRLIIFGPAGCGELPVASAAALSYAAAPLMR